MVLLLQLAIWLDDGHMLARAGLPPGFLHPIGGPYRWPYVISFTLVVIISYNGTWTVAHKSYSVTDEPSASKAAYLSAALNFVGTPLMLLPAIIGRKLLPDLLAQGRTADTYVLLVLKLLPAGVIGIIVGAMFSATMAAISSDLNAIASVLTRDVYFRLINPQSSERKLVSVGRLSTLALGAIVIALSLWIALTQSQSLFHLMVTAFGVFLAPTLLPVLAGLTIRSLTWKGALAGFIFGLIVGFTTFSIKTWYLPSRHDIPAEWANYTFEGISIFLNFAATALGMWFGSVFLKKDVDETSRISSFFRTLDTPISASEVHRQEHDPARMAVGAATVTVGLLLILASLFAHSTLARSIDAALGLILIGLGSRFVYLARQAKKKLIAA